MLERYATVRNIQADGSDDTGTSGQRARFATDIPGRSDLNSPKLGAASNFSDYFLSGQIPTKEEIEAFYKTALQSVAPFLNPDFNQRVDLNYGKADVDSPLLSGDKTLSDLTAAQDQPQYGAPNISSPNVNSPNEPRPAGEPLPLREAGFGNRSDEEPHEHIPSTTRSTIGEYFNNHSRRTGPLGTSKPNET